MNDEPQSSFTELLRALDQAVQAERRWRRGATLALAGFVALAAVSFLQFWSTFLTLGMLDEARQEAGRARAESRQAVEELGKLRDQMHTAAVDVYNARRETRQLEQHLDRRLAEFRTLVQQADEKAPQPVMSTFMKMVLNEIDDSQARPAVQAALVRLEKKLIQLKHEDAKHWPIIISGGTLER